MDGNERNGMRIERWTERRLELQVIHVSLYPFIGGSVEI